MSLRRYGKEKVIQRQILLERAIMSMNLVFFVKGGEGMVDFPFQTPTDLTHAVLKEKDDSKRLALLRKACEDWKWSKKDIKRSLGIVEALMKSPTLEMGMI